MKICLVNESPDLVSKAQLLAMMHALREQAAPFARAWDRLTPIIHAALSLAAAPADFSLIAVLPDADEAGALGYHDVAPDGRPYGRVFVNDTLKAGGSILNGAMSVAVDASHEALEMLGDPPACWWQTYNAAGDQAALELCDPVQEDTYTASNGVELSNFVLPAYFNPAAKGPYDQMGVLRKPAPAIRKGGYLIAQRSSGEHEVFGRPLKRRLAAKCDQHSRTQGRTRGRFAELLT